MARWPAFCGPSYTPASKIAAYDESVNLFCEKIESGTGNGGAIYTLYQTNGFSQFVTLSDSPGRGGLSIGGVASGSSIAGNTYLVSGEHLYLYSATPTTLASGISNNEDVVDMVTNGDQGHQLLFTAGGKTYCFDTTSGVLTDVLVNGSSVGYINRYGLSLNILTSEFRYSGLNDFSTWSALDVVVREDASDNWVRLVVFHNEIWLFGTRTTSIYYNDADATDTPFLPIKSAFMNMGILARNSACIVGGSLFWVGQDTGGNAVVYRANGYNPERVSTHAIENLLQQSGVASNAEAAYYQHNGHDFYELTVSSVESVYVGYTIVYDATEGLWHKRGEWDGLQYAEMDTRGYFGGHNISLSRTSGKVYNWVTDRSSIAAFKGTDGTGIRWLRRAPHISSENKGCIIDSVELKFEPGVANATGAGSDPHFALRFSNNGGQTWSTSQTVSAGLIGEFETRAEWRQLGYGRDRLIEIVGSDPIFTPIIDAYVNVRTGRN